MLQLNTASSYRMPRWVKIAGVITLIIVILAAVMMLSGGEHGPGRHMPAADSTPHTMQHGG